MRSAVRRRAATVMCGALLTAPFWLISAAHAADPVVTFNGQPSRDSDRISCPSDPDTDALTVNPGDTVDFVNHLGVGAVLRSGDIQEDVGNRDMVPVTFNSGPATFVFAMVPHCHLDVATHDQMTVTVNAPGPSDSPTPTASPSTASATASAGPPEGAMPTTGSAGAQPQTQQKPSTPANESSKPSPAPSPSRSGPPSGAGTVGDDDPLNTASAMSSSPGAITIGVPVSEDRSNGASGLLTLIATVSVGGVVAAVIRAILAQRVNRP